MENLINLIAQAKRQAKDLAVSLDQSQNPDSVLALGIVTTLDSVERLLGLGPRSNKADHV